MKLTWIIKLHQMIPLQLLYMYPSFADVSIFLGNVQIVITSAWIIVYIAYVWMMLGTSSLDRRSILKSEWLPGSLDKFWKGAVT